MSTITGEAEFNNSNNNGSIDGTATFNGDSQNSGEIEGTAIFNDSAENNGTVENGVFYDNASNNGEVVDFAVFLDGAQNNGTAGTVVTEPPAITQQPVSVCVNSGIGGNVLFTAAASGDLVNHKWVVDGVDREENEGRGVAYSGNSAELNLSINYGQAYQANVKCRFYNPIGSVETDAVVANVGPLPTVFDPHVAVGPGQETYNEFSTIKVFVEGISYASKVYLQFQVDYNINGNAYVDYGDILELTTTGYPPQGSTTPNFSGLLDSGVILINPQPLRVRVKVSDCIGADETLSWMAYFNDVPIDPPTITMQPVSGSAYAGDYVTFTVEADDNFSGENSLTYQWKRGETPIEGATSNIVNIQIPLGTSAGSPVGTDYTCVITSAYSDYATITNPVTATSLGERPPPPIE
jgi:hypothetical protein